MKQQLHALLASTVLAALSICLTSSARAQDTTPTPTTQPPTSTTPAPTATPAPTTPAPTTQATTTKAVTETTQKVVKPFRIKLGAFFPSDGDARDALGDVWFSYGVSYDVFKTKATNPLIVSAYLDGYNKSKSGNRINMVSIGPAVRYYFNPVVEAPTRFYGGAGLGAYFLNLKASDGESENKTKFGGKIFGGLEFGPGFFGEIDYTFISKIEDFNPGGFDLQIGYRF